MMTQRNDDAPTIQPMTGDDKPKPEEGAEAGPLPSVIGTIGQISGVITVVAGTIYALGMLTLLLPIYNSYDTTFTTAWYMVSLIPKTTVAGYGAKSLLWPSLATVLPIAFITVLVLTVFSLLWVAMRHAARHAKSAKNDILRGVLFTMAVYAGYSTLLGAVTIVMHLVLQGADSRFIHALLQYNIVAASLAYGIFAVLSALTLLLLTLRGAIALTKLAKAQASPYEIFQTFGSLRVALYLALCVGMVCAMIAGLNLVDLGFFSAELLDPEADLAYLPLEIVWLEVLLALIILIPMVLLLLLADRALPSKMLDDCGPILRVVVYSCRIFSM